jgi:competence protein ComEC
LTELEQLIEESRPAWVRLLREFGRTIVRWYLITLVLGIATAPLIIYWQNVVSPVGLLIGPVAILLTSIALIAGFLFLLLSLVGGIAAVPFAWITLQSIAACEWVVRCADRLPEACWYVPNIPIWWVIVFYGIGIAWMSRARLVASASAGNGQRFVPVVRPASFAAALITWVCIGLLAGAWKPAADELRLSFVAVGHGGCTVLEAPDGRVILYDAGTIAGPDVTRRHIAPFLWSHGIRRIDEVFLSHADLDHFNGIPALGERFPVC